ncbi:MAG: class I SAM-dependent methyltransferase [Candidatus Competibacterales bacterium]|nr:class I SAM-dependent methyltransferase [Candidatus Competibacterales bacterium]
MKPDQSGFADHFSGIAGEYARFRPRYPQALFAYLASRSPARDRAWDCATGSGQAALALTRHFTQVVATDASAEQIASAGTHPRIDYRVAPAECSGLETASVDLITVAQALHWFDRSRFYAEAGRVLRPGGVLAVWCYGLIRLGDRSAQALFERFHDAVERYWPPERALIETGYRNLDFPFVEWTPPAFAMTADWTRDELLGYLRTWSAVQRYQESQGIDPVAGLARELATVWPDPQQHRTLTWPLALRCGIAT